MKKTLVAWGIIIGKEKVRFENGLDNYKNIISQKKKYGKCKKCGHIAPVGTDICPFCWEDTDFKPSFNSVVYDKALEEMEARGYLYD